MTEAEALAVVAGAGLVLQEYPPEFLSWLDYMLNNSAVVMEQIADDYYNQLAASITQPMDEKALEAARESWRNQARIRAENLTTQMTTDQLKAIGETIADGLEKGIGPRQIADNLDAVTGLDSVRARQYGQQAEYIDSLGLPPDAAETMKSDLYDKLLEDRKTTIARTEARHATEDALNQNAVARGAQYKVWITAQDNRVSEDCALNEAAGPIPIGDTFPSGSDQPPDHPNCRCSLAYYTNEDQLGTASELAAERAAKTAAAMNADGGGDQ